MSEARLSAEHLRPVGCVDLLSELVNIRHPTRAGRKMNLALLRVSYTFLLSCSQVAMKVRIGFTVFASPTQYHAMIDGELDLPFVPSVGDQVSLMHTPAATRPSVADACLLKVVSRRFAIIDSSAFACTVHLDDVVVEGADAAEMLTTYLEDGYGLNADRAGDWGTAS